MMCVCEGCRCVGGVIPKCLHVLEDWVRLLHVSGGLLYRHLLAASASGATMARLVDGSTGL